MTSRRPEISIVIPTLDERETIEATLVSARAAFGERAEMIVVDGGSRDGTAQIAARRARVIPAPANRGEQLEAGALVARADTILFLHADTRLPADAAGALRTALHDPRVVGGAFRVRLAGRTGGGVALRLLATAINARSRLFATATGDQAIFLRTEALRRLGGVPPVPLFEDVLLYRGMRSLGRVVLLPCYVTSSARRWERNGVLRTALVHLALRALHALGVPPSPLARLYAGLARG